MRGLSLFILFICYSLISVSQDFSNKGRDFWVAYGYHVRMLTTNGGTGSALNAQNMVLYFATEEATTINITVPGSTYSQTLTSGATPTILTSAPIPKSGTQDFRLTAESTAPENKGIHITSDKPIVAYAHIYDQSVSGATILFPTTTLGKEYYSINYTNISNEDKSNCWFYFIATDTGTTTVEVTPVFNTITHSAGTPFTVNLTQGQVYNVMGQLTGGGGGGGIGASYTGVDLTGSKIKSIASGTGGCKRIAVFSGSGKLSLTCTTTSSSADNYMVQAFPKDAWGKKFLTVSTKSLNYNPYRICVSDPATVVRVNGAVITSALINNFYYQIPQTTSPLKIESNIPITVAQYIATQGACGNPSTTTNPGDPEVIYLSPVEQNISRVIWNATQNFAITEHYYNVVIPNTGTAINTFKLDGAVVGSAAFIVHPQDPAYSYLSVRLANSGVHIIESDSGFNAIAYGFGTAESYGYNAGTNIRDLYNKLDPINPLSISIDPVACKGTGIYLGVTFPFQPTSLYWDFQGNPYQSPNTNITVTNPVSDSTYFVGTKQVWRYKLPTLYTFSQSNISPGYPITITAGTTSLEGCGGSVEREFYLQVYDPPNVNFAWHNNGCVNDAVLFTDSTIYKNGTFSYLWNWQFNDGTNDNSHNPSHLYSTPGTYNVKLSLTTNVGCVSDTTIAVTVNPLSVANLSAITAVCTNAPSPTLTFTATTGNTPFIFNYTVNSGLTQSISSATNTATLNIPTSVTGPLTYTLTSVQGAACLQNQIAVPVIVNINPLPIAAISGTDTICQNAAAPNITFTGSGSVAPYTFTYNINGGAVQSATTTSGNSIDVAVSTNSPGTFTYNLLNVTDGSNTACAQNQIGSAIVTVRQLPTATIQGTTALCFNDTAPNITFTGASGTAPYIFTYSINGGSNQSVITTSGNSTTISVPTNVAGTFNYQLISIQESSVNQCSQSRIGNAAVTVYPLPLPNFQVTAPICENRTINFSDLSNPLSASITSWNWEFADSSSAITNQNPSHTFLIADTFNIKLTIINSNGCKNEIIKPIIISPNPAAGFVDPEVCLSDTYAQFADTSNITSGTLTQWLWNFGDTLSGPLNSSVLQNPNHSYSSLGIKNITLIVKSDKGCIDTLYQSFTVNGDIPVSGIQVINSTGLCANDSISIQNTSTVNVGSIVKVKICWDYAGSPQTIETDDYPYPGKIYSHLYNNFQNPLTQTYRIKFYAYSGITCVDSTFKDIVINAAPKVLFNLISDTCLYISPFQITQAIEIGGVPGVFSYSGTGISNTGIFNPAITGTGLHTIKYLFISNAGCRDSATQSIRILEPPLANFGFSTPTCENNIVTFTDSSLSNSGNIVSWTWNFDDGSAPVIKNDNSSITHNFSPARNYAVSLIVKTIGGCNSIATVKNVLINPNPIANFIFSDTACLPNAQVKFINSCTIADGSQGLFTYSWNFGDLASGTFNTSTAMNPNHIYSGLGPYDVTLTVRSGAGCIHDSTITVSTIHPQPHADFDFNKISVCIGGYVQMNDLSNPADGNLYLWQWDFGDGNNSQQQNPIHTYGAPGNYLVSLQITNSYGCLSDIGTDTFNVYAYPVISSGPDLQILEGASASLQATASGTSLQYLWTSSLYLNNPTLLNPLCTPLDSIEYMLTVTGIGGCASQDNVKISFLKMPLIPNTFSPNNDGINDFWKIEYLKFYPYARIQVFTRTGQMVFESTNGYPKPWDGTCKGKYLPMDTYYYIVEPGSGRRPFTGYVTIIK